MDSVEVLNGNFHNQTKVLAVHNSSIGEYSKLLHAVKFKAEKWSRAEFPNIRVDGATIKHFKYLQLDRGKWTSSIHSYKSLMEIGQYIKILSQRANLLTPRQTHQAQAEAC